MINHFQISKLYIFQSIESFLISKKVNIIKNYKVNDIFFDNNVFLINNEIQTNKCIISTCPKGLTEILKNSETIKHNWMPFDELNTLVNESTYISIGFQLHWDKYVEFPKQYCKYCAGDWMIIIIPSSKHMNQFTKDETIQTVWSCTIVDQNQYSPYLNKYVYQCTLDEIKQEVIRQLNVETPKFFTFSDGIKLKQSKYTSKDTGFSAHKYGTLETKGKNENLFVVGPINRTEIITMESGIKSAVSFVKTYYPGNEFKTTNNHFFVFLMLVLLIIFIKYLKTKYE